MRQSFRPEEIDSLFLAFSEMKAENDSFLKTKFERTFVHTSVYSDAQLEGKSILVGGKGSGKTAILIAHEKEHRDKYASVARISLDNMPFSAIFNFFYVSYSNSFVKLNIKQSDISDLLEIAKITSYAWKNALLAVVLLNTSKALLKAKEITPAETAVLRDIVKDLEKMASISSERIGLGHDSPHVFAFLFLFFTLLQDQIEEILATDVPNLAGLFAKLVEKLIEKVSRPTEDSLSGSARQLNQILDRIGKRVFLSLDKFDDYYDKFYEVLRTSNLGENGGTEIRDRKAFLKSLLEGLVLAARDIKDYDEFQFVDALFAIPLDKFVELELRERMDLERRRVIPIRWSPKELYAFANQRIHTALNLKDKPIDQAWGEIFPKTVRNGATKQPEDSFLYVARHSLWKPRELQMHVYGFLEKIKSNDYNALDESDIRESIKESCGQIIRQEFKEEFSKEYPGLMKLLNQLENAKLRTVMPYGEVCDVIRGINLAEDISTPDEVMRRMYKMGIVGVRVARPEIERRPLPTIVQERSRSHIAYRFHYNYPETSPFAPNSTVVIHPMFIDQIGASHEADFIIHELTWDMFV